MSGSADLLYQSFLARLGPRLASTAGAWSFQPAWRPDAPVSHVFLEEATLILPELFAPAVPHAAPMMVENATLSHLLSILCSMSLDRLLEGQAVPSPELLELMNAVRRERDAALARLGPLGADPLHDPARAEKARARALAEEEILLAGHRPLGWEDYERVAHAKQAPAFPATLMLARAGSADELTRERMARILAAVTVGLQGLDDATDWEKAAARGASWPLRLLGEKTGAPLSPALRERVTTSRLLVSLLRRTQIHFVVAGREAATLGLERLKRWTESLGELTVWLVGEEERCPGHVGHWHAKPQALPESDGEERVAVGSL
ncbi:MAG TPA: hypothetical protein VH877_27035 [Polyangia bacterium]|nr:hypothetical protein [Polyangia bacterium]